MYEVFEGLLQKYGVSTYKVSKETGIAQSVFSSWKNGISTPKNDKMKKIADYFGVTVDYLMTGNKEAEKKETKLTPKDERDIKKTLEKIVDDIKENRDGPLYYGDQEIDEDSLLLLADAIEMALRHIKPINKEKYNPNKNKK